MKQAKRGSQSPALIISFVALTLALGGSAIAGTAGITAKLDRTEKKQVKKIAKKQANKTVTKRAPGLAVASAQTAGSANSLNGLRVLPIGHLSAAGTSGVTILDAGGLQIRMDTCNSGQEELRAATTVAGGETRSSPTMPTRRTGQRLRSITTTTPTSVPATTSTCSTA